MARRAARHVSGGRFPRDDHSGFGDASLAGGRRRRGAAAGGIERGFTVENAGWCICNFDPFDARGITARGGGRVEVPGICVPRCPERHGAGSRYQAQRVVLGAHLFSRGGGRVRLPARLTLALLAAVFALCVYRAATQAIIIDEAFTYIYFVAPPLSEVMTTYNTNDHIPTSLLAKITTSLFGVSELTLRMPSLLCCLIYLVAVRAIALAVFSGEWAVMVFALLSLNPIVLDLMVAARGYGPALAFLMAALWFLLRTEWARGGI